MFHIVFSQIWYYISQFLLRGQKGVRSPKTPKPRPRHAPLLFHEETAIMPKLPKYRFSEKKFKELILYIASQCEKDRYWGAIKLNKVLFYSDFLAYKLLGESITGADYQALERGPAPRQLCPIRDEMIRTGDLAIDKRSLQHRPIALREPDLRDFDAREIAIVNKVMTSLRHANADRASEMSHAFLGWKAAWEETKATGKNVVIPYGTVFVANPPLDEFEEAHGLELAKAHGW
jgi:hypothetical protein